MIRGRVFYGWWILTLGSLIIAVAQGIFYHSFTVFFLPLKRDFEVGSVAISFLYGAARLEGGVEGPLVGYLIDRFGPKVLITMGAIFAGIGYILLSTVHSFWAFFLIYTLIISLGYNAGYFHPISAAVNSWFVRRRGIGNATIMAAGSLGGVVMAPLLSYIILNFGWRNGTLFAGLLILITSLPAGLLMDRSPEEKGLYPDGIIPEKKYSGEYSSGIQTIPETDLKVKEALRNPCYWLLFTGITLRLLVTVALAGHLIPILVWKGMDETTSAYMVSLFTFLSIVTTLMIGWMGDKFNKAILCSAGILPTVFGMVGLVINSSESMLFAFSAGLAVTMGTAPLNWSLIGDLFGRHIYATLRGIMGVGYGTATFLSPIYAGWVFDRTGSYTMVLITFAIILLIATFLFFILYRNPIPKKEILNN
jgi:sugar phosphate permease